MSRGAVSLTTVHRISAQRVLTVKILHCAINKFHWYLIEDVGIFCLGLDLINFPSVDINSRWPVAASTGVAINPNFFQSVDINFRWPMAASTGGAINPN